MTTCDLDRVPHPVWISDRAGQFRYANPAAVAALGYADRSELEGRQSHEHVVSKFPDESWLVRKDGSTRRIACSTAHFDLPDGPGSITAFTEIAEFDAARRRAIEAADLVRTQLTRDLHDGAQQQFVTALLHFQRRR